MQDVQKEALIEDFRKSLNGYAKSCLTIRGKDERIDRFPGFQKVQKQVHNRLEQQRKDTGKVRALILKARQQGISTYIAARFYRRATLYRGVNVFILAHEQSASDTLFGVVDRFHKNNPIAPHTGTSNVKELEFDKLDSSYHVATAGQKESGRSKTTSLFHGSEVAFWQNAQAHFASSVQTVPDLPNTEIILESTANGASGEFYERWNDAIAQKGDYIAVFVPWFHTEEYRRVVGPDFELSDEPGDDGISEKEYFKLFEEEGLNSLEQMAWRRAKLAELRTSQKFNQEYPGSPSLAFSSADVHKALILPMAVLRARKRQGVMGAGPLIVGVDPSGPGKDRFAVAWRQGMKVLRIEHRQLPETAEAVEWICSIIDKDQPDRMNVDLGNIGHSIVSLAKARGDGYARIIRGVNFGSKSQSKFALPNIPGPGNRRAEMWDRLREWIDHEDGASLPDMEDLQADLTAPHKKPLINGDFLIESKQEMQRRGVRSPDLGDAVALTFADLERIISAESRRERSKKQILHAPASAQIITSDPGIFVPTYGGENAWMGL